MSKRESAKVPITLYDNALEAFNKIKNSLSSEEVIFAFPNFEKEFHLTTDASSCALGAVLEQEGKPVTFISRTLNKAEENYATNEKEMLAIVWALKTLRNYLYGSAAVKIFKTTDLGRMH
ncbi:Retrovirus-related Pol polyprotein from transposon gypsy [Eumeta japonica]|uniref:Retrovirus-related Pol polyprotein from transposon gypsy n=1 Tax=Eumeta variegata TaxID=151549 RepID=A0A4C1TIG7_EUMVA|nr:Retrovirus-related Pol polyprotein from transposon gypsy [Eumeta japonica]